MIIRWLVSSLHFPALAIGLGAVFARSRLLRCLRTVDDLPSVIAAAAAGRWISQEPALATISSLQLLLLLLMVFLADSRRPRPHSIVTWGHVAAEHARHHHMK